MRARRRALALISFAAVLVAGLAEAFISLARSACDAYASSPSARSHSSVRRMPSSSDTFGS